jgi:hypothetical protein
MNEQKVSKETETKPDGYTVLGDVFLTLLNRFKSNDYRRDWMTTPFNVENKTVATNGYILIATPLQEGFDDLSNKTKGVYPMPFILDNKISVLELKQKLNDFPKVDCFDEEEKECDACDGYGEVDFYFSHNGEDYEREEECPVCEGNGIIEKISKTPNGKKELDYNKFFGIGNSVFNVARIEELLEVAETLESDEITLVNQTQPNKASLFKIKEVEILLMPTMCNDLTNVVQKVA